MSAVQLYMLGKLLGVPIDFFYRDLKVDAAQSVREPRADDIITERTRRRLRVLLVEDNSHDQLLFVKAVEACEVEADVFCCNTALEAEDYFRNLGSPASSREPPDLVFLDLKLPKLSGLEFLRSIARNPNYWHQPIIVLSNTVNAGEMYDCYKNGASAFVCKPYDFHRFVEVIQAIFVYWSETVVAPTTY